MIGIYFLVDNTKDNDLRIHDLPKENLDINNVSPDFESG